MATWMTLIALSPLIASVLWIAGLTVTAVCVGRRRDARDLTKLALIFAAIGSLSFVLWPLWVGVSGSVQVAIDATTGAQTSMSSQQITLLPFPYLHLLGPRAVLFGAIPVAATALAYVWQVTRLPAIAAVRVVCLFALGAWLIVGTVSGVSWWSVPATTALLLAATRSDPSAAGGA